MIVLQNIKGAMRGKRAAAQRFRRGRLKARPVRPTSRKIGQKSKMLGRSLSVKTSRNSVIIEDMECV